MVLHFLFQFYSIDFYLIMGNNKLKFYEMVEKKNLIAEKNQN